MLDTGDDDVAARQMAEPGNVAAAAEVDDGFALIHLSFDRAKALWHEGDFLQRIADHGDSAFGDLLVLAREKIVQSLQIINGLGRILYSRHVTGDIQALAVLWLCPKNRSMP